MLANFILLAGLLLVSNRANALARGPREPPDHAARARRRRPARRADRRDDLLADVGGRRPRRPAGQPDRARRAVHDRARRDHGRRSGRLLARNVARKVGGRTLYFRDYPTNGLAAHVVGYSTQSRFRTGLERSLNDYLTGSNANLVDCARHDARPAQGATIEGNDVRLTLNARAQRTALERARHPLRRRRRARARHGQRARDGLLADVRPERRSRANFGRATSTRADCKRPDALLNRATPGLYAPGSTFKVVTASAAIDCGRFTPSSSFVDPGYCEVYGKRVNNYDTTSPFGRLDLRAALKYSINSVFCNIGKELGAKTLVEYAKKLRLLLDAARSRRRRRAGAERPLQGDEAVRPAGGQRRRPGPVRVRPGAPAGDAAADGDGRGDDRERRRPHEPVRRRPDRGAERVDVVAKRSRSAWAGRSSRRPPRRSRR